MDFDIPTRWMSMVVREPTQRLTYEGDIIDNPICRYNGQDVELVYDPNNGECDIKEDLINLNAGDQIKVKGMMKVEPVDVKGMLAIRTSLTVEDIIEDEDDSEQAEESGSDYGSGQDDETGTEEYHDHATSNTGKHNIAHHPDTPPHNEPYHNTSTTGNRIINQHPGRSGHNEPYHNTLNTNNLNIAHAGHDDLYHNMSNTDRSTHGVPYHNIFNTKKFNTIRLNKSIHDDTYRTIFNAKNLNTGAGHDDRYHSSSNAHKRNIAYHPYKPVHVDPVHEMSVDHRGRSIKRPCTPYPKTNSKQHHRGISAPRFGSDSVIGHREMVDYRHGHAKVFGSAENQALVSRQNDEEEDQRYPLRYNPVTRAAWSHSMMPNKQERQDEVLVHDTPVSRMFRSPSFISIKQEEDEGLYVLDCSNVYVANESDQDIHSYPSPGPAQGEQQANGSSPEVNGSSSRQFEPLFYDNLIPPMVPMRTMTPMPPLQPMSPTPPKSPTSPRSPMPFMSPLPSMWSMWSVPTLPPRSQINHPIWVHPFTHQCSDGSLREELCWDSWCTREGRCWTVCCG